jgi:hypothetical protein
MNGIWLNMTRPVFGRGPRPSDRQWSRNSPVRAMPGTVCQESL